MHKLGMTALVLCLGAGLALGACGDDDDGDGNGGTGGFIGGDGGSGGVGPNCNTPDASATLNGSCLVPGFACFEVRGAPSSVVDAYETSCVDPDGWDGAWSNATCPDATSGRCVQGLGGFTVITIEEALDAAAAEQACNDTPCTEWEP